MSKSEHQAEPVKCDRCGSHEDVSWRGGRGPVHVLAAHAHICNKCYSEICSLLDSWWANKSTDLELIELLSERVTVMGKRIDAQSDRLDAQAKLLHSHADLIAGTARASARMCDLISLGK